MTFEIEINGRMRTVAVETASPSGGRFRVIVDSEVRTVDAVQVEDDTLSVIFPEQGHESHEVGFSEGLLPAEVDVYLHSGTLKAIVNGRRSRRATESTAVGEQRVVAPMPGKVVRVLASRGQVVNARQPLVVVEAMKMENELASPKAGRVKEVAVSEGASVEAGRLLVIVE